MKTITATYFFALIFLLLMASTAFSQNIAINTSGASADPSSVFDVSSTNKGVLIPRVSLTSLTAASPLTNPANSILVYNTNASIYSGVGFYYNSGTSGSPVWIKLVAQTDSSVKSFTPSGAVIALERFPMGELSMNGNTTLTNIPSANTWVKVGGTTTFSSSESYNFSNGGVNNRLVYTGPKMKAFHIACTLSVKSTSSGSNMKAVLYKNGVPLTAGIVQTKMGNSSDIVSTAIHVMTHMSTGDYLELWITNTASGADFTITEMNLFAMGISMGMD